MRIAVRHETFYSYTTPPNSIIQILRLTPRSHEGQHVIRWRIDCDADCRLKAGEDAFGNITHEFTVTRPINTLSLVAEGHVETFDTGGVVANAVERFPSGLYLRETPLTRADPVILALARDGVSREPIGRMHDLMTAIHKTMIFDTQATNATTTAAEAFARGRGVCQDYVHIFIAAARAIGVPARYVGGHFCRNDGVTAQEAGHAWAEAFVEGLGWVGFDPTNGICPRDAHIRITCGLDYLHAAPVRGARTSGAGEKLTVKVAVSQAATQSQN